MHFSNIITTLLTASTASAYVLPRQANGTYTNNTLPPLSLDSDNFILRSQLLNDTTTSLGYLYAEYSYPPGYSATLHTARSDAIVGHLTDTTNVANSTLVFGDDASYPKGFVLGQLSKQYPTGLAQMYSGQPGTKGVFVNEGGLLEWASAGGRMSWFACYQGLEWGPATALWYKWANATTPSNCFDIQLVAEFVE